MQRSDVGLYFCKAPYETPPKNSFTYLIDCEYYLLKTECAAEDLPCRVTLLSVSTKPKEEIVGSVKDFKNYTQFYIGEVNKVLSCKTFAENTTNIKVSDSATCSDNIFGCEPSPFYAFRLSPNGQPGRNAISASGKKESGHVLENVESNFSWS